jgi:hypothetical protein
MILKIFSPKNLAKKMAFLTSNKAKLCKNLIITLVFEKNAIFAKNRNIEPRNQSYDRELQRQRCKNLQRHE